LETFGGAPIRVSVNIPRRHPDAERAEVAIKSSKLFRKIARDRWLDSQFNSETAWEAGIISQIKQHEKTDADTADERLASPEASRYLGESNVVDSVVRRARRAVPPTRGAYQHILTV